MTLLGTPSLENLFNSLCFCGFYGRGSEQEKREDAEPTAGRDLWSGRPHTWLFLVFVRLRLIHFCLRLLGMKNAQKTPSDISGPALSDPLCHSVCRL